MENLLANLGPFGLLISFAGLIVLFTLGLRKVMVHKTQPIPPETSTLQTTKKYTDVDINQYRGLIRNVSIALSLAIVVAVMEFPSSNNNSLIELTSDQNDMFEEIQDIPVTEQPPPPPPETQEIRGAEIIEVDEEIEEEIKVIFDTEFDENLVIEETVPQAEAEVEIEEEETDEVYLIVEEAAVPVGGYDKFYEFIGKELRYPKKAIVSAVEGKVYVNFIVDKEGNLTNFKVARGIGAGCDEEAIRVLKLAPNWQPAKQRGLKVKQSIIIPIHFKLAN